jgi:hypothetical protein
MRWARGSCSAECFIFTEEFLGTNLENPADTLLHLMVGAWALLAS